MSTPADPVEEIVVDVFEQREYPRIPMNELRLRSGPFEFRGTGDLSLGGAAWSGDAWAIDPSTLEVSFELAEGPTYRVRGEVVSVRDAGIQKAVHVRFDSLPFEVERAIARHTDSWMSSLQRELDFDVDVEE